MVDRWINTFMVQVDADGAAQSLVERERTVTEVVHWDAPNTGEAAHRERIRYQQVGGGWVESFLSDDVSKHLGSTDRYIVLIHPARNLRRRGDGRERGGGGVRARGERGAGGL